MPLFDQERMIKLVSELRKSVERLRNLGTVSENAFLKNPDKIGSAKYHFIVAIEACIDMCNHVISRNGFRVPDNYGDTFIVLAEAGAWNEQFSNELKSMAKFRNRLVHLYWEIDDHQLYKFLQVRIDDFKKFLDAMGRFLEWNKI